MATLSLFKQDADTITARAANVTGASDILTEMANHIGHVETTGFDSVHSWISSMKSGLIFESGFRSDNKANEVVTIYSNGSPLVQLLALTLYYLLPPDVRTVEADTSLDKLARMIASSYVHYQACFGNHTTPVGYANSILYPTSPNVIICIVIAVTAADASRSAVGICNMIINAPISNVQNLPLHENWHDGSLFSLGLSSPLLSGPEPYGVIYNVCVAPLARGQGLAKLIVGTLVGTVGLRMKLRAVWLGVDITVPGPELRFKLYASLGFKVPQWAISAALTDNNVYMVKYPTDPFAQSFAGAAVARQLFIASVIRSTLADAFKPANNNTVFGRVEDINSQRVVSILNRSCSLAQRDCVFNSFELVCGLPSPEATHLRSLLLASGNSVIANRFDNAMLFNLYGNFGRPFTDRVITVSRQFPTVADLKAFMISFSNTVNPDKLVFVPFCGNHLTGSTGHAMTMVVRTNLLHVIEPQSQDMSETDPNRPAVGGKLFVSEFKLDDSTDLFEFDTYFTNYNMKEFNLYVKV